MIFETDPRVTDTIDFGRRPRTVMTNWRLASWHNITLWVPSDPEVPLVQLYTEYWKVPDARASGHYSPWMQNKPIPAEERRSYFKNSLDLSATNVLKLQERLEQENANQIAEDARKQWTLAVDFCAK